MAAYDERREAARRAYERRAEVLRERLPSLAALCRDAGANRVLLFGSLATGAIRRKRLDGDGPDVDLAVEGLSPTAYLDLLASLEEAAESTVDLVRLETAPSTLVQRVLREGREL